MHSFAITLRNSHLPKFHPDNVTSPLVTCPIGIATVYTELNCSYFRLDVSFVPCIVALFIVFFSLHEKLPPTFRSITLFSVLLHVCVAFS